MKLLCLALVCLSLLTSCEEGANGNRHYVISKSQIESSDETPQLD